jgi:hypothetical protein
MIQATASSIPIVGFSLDALIALAAMFLGLSVAVQVAQEIWKYLLSSKSRLYQKLLRDFLGDRIDEAGTQKLLKEIRSRGAFQWFSPQTPSRLMPLSEQQLVRVLIRLAGEEVRKGIEVLEAEARSQDGTPAPATLPFREWVRSLWAGGQDNPCSAEMFEQLVSWKVVKPPAAPAPGGVAESEGSPSSGSDLEFPEPFDAAAILEHMTRTFVPDVSRVRAEYPQFETNFQYSNQRQNLRQTVVLGLAIALLWNLPLDALWRHANALSPEEVIELSQAAMNLEAEWEAKRAESGSESTPPQPPPSAPGQDAGGSAGPTSGPETGSTTEEPTGTTGETKAKAAAGDGSEAKPEQEIRDLLGDLRKAVSVSLFEPGARAEAEPREALGDKGDTSGEEDSIATTAAPFGSGWDRIDALWDAGDEKRLLGHLLYCLLTALFVAFGAPFWHRLGEALLSFRRVPAVGRSQTQPQGGASG